MKSFLNKFLVGLFILRILNRRSAVKLIKFALKRYLLRKRIPAVAIFALTYRCQARCGHCSAGLYKNNSEELEIGEWKKVIDELDKLGVPRLHISGGEPTLKSGFAEIIEYACSRGMLTFLETNGYSLDAEKIKYLTQTGLASIDVSLDSSDPGIHDNSRKLSGAFNKAIEVLKICKSLKMPHMVSIYAGKKNIYSGELSRLIYFAKKMKFSAIRILPPQPSGRWLHNFTVGLEEKDRAYLRSTFPVYTILDRLNLPYCPIKDKYTVFIGADGLIHPCPHLPFSFGNVRQTSIDTALERMQRSPMFQKDSICYINDAGFREQFIMPILEKDIALPVKVDG